MCLCEVASRTYCHAAIAVGGVGGYGAEDPL